MQMLLAPLVLLLLDLFEVSALSASCALSLAIAFEPGPAHTRVLALGQIARRGSAPRARRRLAKLRYMIFEDHGPPLSPVTVTRILRL